jgi:hypothetical protein
VVEIFCVGDGGSGLFSREHGVILWQDVSVIIFRMPKSLLLVKVKFTPEQATKAHSRVEL